MRTLNTLDSNFIDLEKVVYYFNRTTIYRNGHRNNGFKKELIHNEYDYIKSRYEEYESYKEQLENIPDSKFIKTKCLTKSIYCELYSLYDSKEELKEKIRDKSESRCPYCGIIETPYHVDHILPRSKYPEFSMFSHNLVGVCSVCNSRYKGDIFVEDGERQFFNPYGDSFINDVEFIECILSVDDIYLLIDFSLKGEEDNSYGYTIIKNHFTKLHLNSRYKKILLQDELKRFRDGYIDEYSREYEDVTLDELKRDLNRKIREFRSFNCNHWEKIFWKALKECDEYLNLIVEKRLPFD